jgi:hypothetical protein
MVYATWDQASGGYLVAASEFTTGAGGTGDPRLSSITAKAAFVKSGGKFVHVNSPANAGTTLGYYPSLAAYLGSASGAPTTKISIKNSYGATTATPETTICTHNGGKAFAAQCYSASVKYDSTTKTLAITGNGSDVGNFTIKGWTPVASPPKTCKGSTGAQGTSYTAVLYYAVSNPACTGTDVESNGANDVFSAVVRDLLVGLASGFENSATASPAATYGKMTSSQWSTHASAIFGGVQATNPYYNTWAGAVYDTFGSRVYGFQYSDFFTSEGPIGNPRLSLRPSMPAQIVVMKE